MSGMYKSQNLYYVFFYIYLCVSQAQLKRYEFLGQEETEPKILIQAT